ncbi:MAG: BrnT family toxin [Chloroflexota bacterium]
MLWERVGWDSEKARRNAAKHGVSFADARAVVRDPLQLVEADEIHSRSEERLRVIGSTRSGQLLVLIVAVDLTGTIRLISARRPTRRERHDYEGTH